MRLLLDSHAALWGLSDPDRLRPWTRALIEDGANAIWVSSASVWELRLKAAKGKLALPPTFEESLVATGFRGLSITWSHARAACALPRLHTDPFDRLLVAQAHEEDLVLVTRDRVLSGYGVATVEA